MTYSDFVSRAANPLKDRLSDTLYSTRLPAHLVLAALDSVPAGHTQQVVALAAAAHPRPPTASAQKACTAAAYHTRLAWVGDVYR